MPWAGAGGGKRASDRARAAYLRHRSLLIDRSHLSAGRIWTHLPPPACTESEAMPGVAYRLLEIVLNTDYDIRQAQPYYYIYLSSKFV